MWLLPHLTITSTPHLTRNSWLKQFVRWWFRAFLQRLSSILNYVPFITLTCVILNFSAVLMIILDVLLLRIQNSWIFKLIPNWVIRHLGHHRWVENHVTWQGLLANRLQNLLHILLFGLLSPQFLLYLMFRELYGVLIPIVGIASF